MKRILILAVALVWGVLGLGASPLTMDQAVAQALMVNVDYQNALLAVDRAREAQVPVVNWKGIAVSATQKQTSGTASASPGAATAASTTTLGLNLPLFDQLGASATVDQDQNAQVSVTANPLAHSDAATQAQIAYDKAVLAAAQARVTLETGVRKAWLAQATAQAQVEVQKKQTALRETAYQDSKVEFDKGQVTLTEVRTALKAWTDARSTQTTLEKNLVRARADLALRLQADVDLEPLDAAGLQALVEALGPVDTTVTGAATAVRVQALEVKAAQAKADAVWLLDPGLSVSANANLPASGTATWSGSVTLTLSLGSWQGSDRSLADRSLALAQGTLEAQKSAARSSQTQALLAVQSAAATVESRQLSLTQAQELLRQTQLLARAGSATDLDLEDAALGVESAKIDLFTAWSDLYGARLDLSASKS